MPGPPPNPNARRRNDRDAWRTLPATCDRPAPAWPLPGRKPAGLVQLWRHLWALPVAEVWHEQNAVRLLARYSLLVLANEAELANPTAEGVDPVKVAAELRQLEDRLLISPLPRLKARILVAERPATPAPAGENVRNLDDYRDLGVA